MELLKKIKVSEFATRWQISRQAIYKFASEGKLLVVKGCLNETIPTNRQWIEARQVRFSEQEMIEQEASTEAPADTNQSSLTELKKLNLSLDAEFKSLRNKEKEGKLISVELVKVVISQYFESFKMEIMHSTDLLIRDTLNELQAPNILITRRCSTLVDLINEANKAAYENITNGIDSIIDSQNH